MCRFEREDFEDIHTSIIQASHGRGKFIILQRTRFTAHVSLQGSAPILPLSPVL
jgi:hypothetical protein